MGRIVIIWAVILLTAAVSTAQSENDFSGTWKLNAGRSEIRGMPSPPDPVIKLEQKPTVLIVSGGELENGPFRSWTYPLNGAETKQRLAGVEMSTRTKWEGSALLVNTLVSGPQNYTVMERWKKSRDGSTLTVKRTIVRLAGETESVLLYENSAVRPAVAGRPAGLAEKPGVPALVEEYVVEAGTRVLLSLVSSVNTKQAAAGDRVYLQTDAPVLARGRVVIPRGSYVTGTVSESQRAGRVKGKASLYLRFDSLTLPNGAARDLRSRIGNADANVDRAEGRITGDGTKGRDAGTIGQTTAAGASVGSIAGRSAAGAGIGAAAGAAAGLIGVLSSRGADVVLPKGTPVEMVLDRELRFTAAELQPAR